LDEFRNPFPAFDKRSNLDGEDAQAVIQAFAEPLFAKGVLHPNIGRHMYAHIDSRGFLGLVWVNIY
jgi:hypothetical protein